jgi:hypothetical protein
MFKFISWTKSWCGSRKKKKVKTVAKAAGYFFTNGVHVLAGYQPKGSKSIISGIGGKIENDEKWQQTAVREVFEELLGIEVPEGFVPPEAIRSIKSGPYIFAIATFEDLEVFLRAATLSPFYEEMPTNISDLILKRINNHQEVQQLVLLPVNSELVLDPDFLKDMGKVSNL